MQEPVYRRRVSSGSEGSSPLECEELFVVAVDFGTSYTGYAYAQRYSFETDPLKLCGMKIDGNQVFQSMFQVCSDEILMYMNGGAGGGQTFRHSNMQV